MTQPTGTLVNGAPQFYFALDSSPDQPEVTAPAFVATGVGQPGNDGRFIARGDAAAGAPALAFQMRTQGVSALQQWNIGMTDTPAGANSGNNFAIIAYDDAGAPLSTPLSINRATGAIETSDVLTVGDGTEVGGALLEVNGTLGPSRVYDASYNPPPAALPPQIDYLQIQSSPFPASPLPAGATTSTVGAVFQVPTTGLYIMGGAVGINSAVGETFTCADGDFVFLTLSTLPVGGLQGGVAIDMTPIPLGIEVDRVWANTNVFKLTGGLNYQCSLSVYNLSGTMAYSAGNTVTSQFTLTALC